jgi:hypothetical protein
MTSYVGLSSSMIQKLENESRGLKGQLIITGKEGRKEGRMEQKKG